MKLALDRQDLRKQHRDINCSFTRFKHFTKEAQAAIAFVGRATFWEYDRSNYNAIRPPKSEKERS